MYIPPHIFVSTDRELFEAEAEIIKRITNDHSAVIIGRCGSHILRAARIIPAYFYMRILRSVRDVLKSYTMSCRKLPVK